MMQVSRVPYGYGQAPGSDLLVPTELAREREVWTREEWKTLERARKLAASRGVVLKLGCPECREPLKSVTRLDGQPTLRCAHKDREITRL